MRAMVARGDLGKIRLIKAEFAHGFHADAADADNPRVVWRYDPEQAGISAQFADCGIHALHMASFVSGQQAEQLSADFASCIESRALEDDAMLNIKIDGGATCRLWTSSVAIGRMHGLNIQVFGEKGGMRWAQEWPNQLYWTPLNGHTEGICPLPLPAKLTEPPDQMKWPSKLRHRIDFRKIPTRYKLLGLPV
jgi:predicted dehydrogenase